MRPPKFWYADSSPVGRLLAPLGYLYSAGVRVRFKTVKPYRSSLPVVCIGNLVAGGAGKTPTVITVARLLHEEGHTPHVLLRGYSGSIKGPVEVGRTAHRITDVGDEALLLAGHLPAWVSANRAEGAKAIQRQGLATVILMDDGFQNPGLYKDLSLVVIDGASGFGNGRIIPAGPLREPVRAGLRRADGVVLVGEDQRGVADTVRKISGLPAFAAHLVPGPGMEKFRGRKVVGFAGIGRPEKFRKTLEDVGADIVGWHSFPDHYTYRMSQIWKIADEASDKRAVAVTTEKDYVRLSEEAKKKIEAFAVSLQFEDESAVRTLLQNMRKQDAA